VGGLITAPTACIPALASTSTTSILCEPESFCDPMGSPISHGTITQTNAVTLSCK
jgi:hypothetical protein